MAAAEQTDRAAGNAAENRKPKGIAWLAWPGGALRVNLRVTERFIALMSFRARVQSGPCPQIRKEWASRRETTAGLNNAGGSLKCGILK